MKILYIHQYFKTPRDPGGTRSYWISKELINNGHEVTMIAARYPQKRRIHLELIDGIKVYYVRVNYSNKMGFLKRLFAFIRFMYSSTLLSLSQKGIDVAFATSTPLTVGFPALILNKLKGTPYVFEVRDLWPEVPIQMGALKNPIMKGMALWLEKAIYANSQQIIALSPGMKNGVINRGIPEEIVSMIPNMAKIDKFYSRPRNTQLIQKLGLQEDTFKVVYFGTLGKANAIDYIIDVAELLKNEVHIEFIIIGRGAMDKFITESIRKKSLSNVHFLGAFNMEITSQIVNFCDLSLVTFSSYPILGTNSPNKLFDSLSAAKPLIVNSPGWTKDLVNDHNCGIYVNTNEPGECANSIKELSTDPVRVKTMADNARFLAETVYDKSILCPKVVQIIELASKIT